MYLCLLSLIELFARRHVYKPVLTYLHIIATVFVHVQAVQAVTSVFSCALHTDW
jgi:hypothetical protein